MCNKTKVTQTLRKKLQSAGLQQFEDVAVSTALASLRKSPAAVTHAIELGVAAAHDMELMFFGGAS